MSRGQKNVPRGVVAAKSSLMQKVEAFLEANAPVEFQPKFIAFKLKASHEAVKKAIQRDMENPKSNIVRIRPGWYRIAYSIEHFGALAGESRVGLHGLQFSGKCPDNPTRLYLVKNSVRQYKNHGTYSLAFRGRPVTIEVFSKSPTVAVWLNATNSPLTLDEFDKFCYWIYGWAEGRGIPENTWVVKQFGLNFDKYKMDMTKSGFKRMTLSMFRRYWIQIYQKGLDMVRTEVHGVSDTLTPTDLMRITHTFVDIIERGQKKYEPPPPDKYDPSIG